MMTKNEVNRIVTMLANGYGFKTREPERFGTIEIVGEYVNFFTKVEWDASYIPEDGTVHVGLEFRASVNQMGGNPTTEELVREGNEIIKAATLVDLLNGWDFHYTEEVMGH